MANKPAPAKQYYLTFVPENGLINCGHDASLVDLPFADFTVDFWIKPTAPPSSGGKSLLCKDDGGWENGWALFLGQYGTYHDLTGFVGRSGSAAWLYTAVPLPHNQWTHVAISWDVSEDLFYTAYNGTWIEVYERTGDGDLGTDADIDLRWGRDFPQIYGSPPPSASLGWMRISSGFRWTPGVAFTSPKRVTPPVVDGTTLELWALDEGSGATARASVNAANNGTITDCTWTEDA
ncbi:MAG: LamG domain-containing protein [Chloroflexi bacterium]|nr:LamG domain-containing protein [Chloroflexota bacterium]